MTINFRTINTPKYKAWEIVLNSPQIRVTRFAIGENKRFALGIHIVLKGSP